MTSPFVVDGTRMGEPAEPCPDGPPMDNLGRIWLEPGQTTLSDAQKRCDPVRPAAWR